MNKNNSNALQTYLVCQTAIIIIFSLAIFFAHASGWWFVVCIIINTLLGNDFDKTVKDFTK